MKPLALDDLVSREHYARIRAPYRQSVIDHKRHRRVSIGEKATLVFEDRETLRFQVLEMAWIEGITQADRLQHELDVYNELVPGAGELSATLFLEITDLDRIRPELDRLLGIDEHVALVFGEGDAEELVRARFDARQMSEDRISAVHYLRFPLGEAAERLREPDVRARLRSDHPHYPREAEVSPDLRAALERDLAGGVGSLLPAVGAEATAEEVDQEIFRDTAVRALRPARPLARAHVIVEPLEPVPSLLDAEPELLAALQEAVRRVAREIVAAHGSCRVEAHLGPGAERLQWHVLGPR